MTVFNVKDRVKVSYGRFYKEGTIKEVGPVIDKERCYKVALDPAPSDPENSPEVAVVESDLKRI